MKRYRLNELSDVREGHFLKGILPGKFIREGTMGYKAPGFRTHTGEPPSPSEGLRRSSGPGGSDVHVHDDCEAFVILQGKAVMECDGKEYALVTGDVLVIEPGEDHHLVADKDDPCINLWLHGGPERHPDQRAK